MVLAAPAHALAALRLEALHGDRLTELAAIPHPPVATLVLGFRQGRRRASARRLRHAGACGRATAHSRCRVLLDPVPHRAPADHVTLSVFAGGSPAAGGRGTRADRAGGPDPAGARRAPRRARRARLPGIRPLAARHSAVRGRLRSALAALDAIEAANPTLRFAGSYRRGVALGDALRSGLDAADALHARL